MKNPFRAFPPVLSSFCLKADVACLGPDDFDFHSFFFPEKNLTQAVSFDTMVFGINRLR